MLFVVKRTDIIVEMQARPTNHGNTGKDMTTLLMDLCIVQQKIEVARRVRSRLDQIVSGNRPLLDGEYHRVWVEEEKLLLQESGVEFQSLDELRESVLANCEQYRDP
jgi:hypothetical protein